MSHDKKLQWHFAHKSARKNTPITKRSNYHGFSSSSHRNSSYVLSRYFVTRTAIIAIETSRFPYCPGICIIRLVFTQSSDKLKSFVTERKRTAHMGPFRPVKIRFMVSALLATMQFQFVSERSHLFFLDLLLKWKTSCDFFLERFVSFKWHDCGWHWSGLV